jgi:Rab proteins geranylgeranyltransferase component A
LTLSPHLIYSQSGLLSVIVSSRLHEQLEFQAIGPWWIYKDNEGDRGSKRDGIHSDSTPKVAQMLQKIPSTREDVFADDSLSARDKRSLMKFLRSILSEPPPDVDQPTEESLSSQLTARFGLSHSLQAPLLALSLSYDSGKVVRNRPAVSRIKRHLRSIGTFGPGFGAVMAKYGGGAEIAQVACRAGAVGGAVYALGYGLKKVFDLESGSPESQPRSEELVGVEFSTAEKAQTRLVVGCIEDLPKDMDEDAEESDSDLYNTMHSISIVSSALEHLFPPTADDGPVPAGAMVVDVGDGDQEMASDVSVSQGLPVYMLIHSSDSGECPAGHCKSSNPPVLLRFLALFLP